MGRSELPVTGGSKQIPAAAFAGLKQTPFGPPRGESRGDVLGFPLTLKACTSWLLVLQELPVHTAGIAPSSVPSGLTDPKG